MNSSQLLVEVFTSSRPAAERARQLVSKNHPWDIASSRQFDDRSLWLVFLKPETRQFRGCARMVFPSLDGQPQNLPLELGEDPNFKLPVRTGLHCEAAGIHLANKPGNGVQQIVGGVVSWAKVAGVSQLYTVLNEPQLKAGYEGLGFEDVKGTHWPLLSLEKDSIDSVASTLGRQYFIRHMQNVDEQLKRLRGS